MRKEILIITFVVASCFSPLSGQNNKPVNSSDLERLFGRLAENLNSQEKLAINDSIRLIIDSYASSDTVFKHRFTNLRYLGQITSTDSLIKIITWNLILEDGENRYFCYLIRRSGKTRPGKVYKFSGLYRETQISSDTIYSLSNWYGALYYDVRPFKLNDQVYYILLGIDFGNSFITRKIIDVLSFNQNNEIVFGMNCFTDGKEIKPRVVFEFTSTAVMSLRFNTYNSIVFDHLSPVSPEYKDNHQFYGPDFSYDSYNFENGLWRLKRDIDIRIKE
jgi:hypothetical protein